MYYPLSQITPNLYTNGGELVISSTLENYIGYYYETSTGEKYVGSIPQGNDSILLIVPPLKTTEEETYSEKYIREFSFPGDADPTISVDHSLINELTQKKYSYVSPQETPKVRKIPTPIKPYYSNGESNNGEYKRYFAKKTNEFIYMEISLEDYKKLKSEDPTIAFDLYNCIEMWYIINPNYNSTSFSFPNEKNSQIIENTYNWFGFSSWFLTLSPPSLNPNSPINFSPSTSTSGGGY
jgi:hypothetical protein